jgi:TetR/AcrR family transcriptional regulator
MPKVIPEYRKEATNRILRAALEVFIEKGYFRSTMDDVAKKLNISKATIYLYFRSKEHLLKEIYLSGPENLRNEFYSTSNRNFKESAKEVFNRMAKKSSAKLFADFLAEASRNVELQKVLRDNIDKFCKVGEEFIAKGFPNLAKKDPKKIHDLAITLLVIYQGLITLLASGVSESDVREMWANSIDLLFDDILQRN